MKWTVLCACWQLKRAKRMRAMTAAGLERIRKKYVVNRSEVSLEMNFRLNFIVQRPLLDVKINEISFPFDY